MRGGDERDSRDETGDESAPSNAYVEKKKSAGKEQSKVAIVSCLRELIPLPEAVSSSRSLFLKKIEDSKNYAQDTTALIRAQYAELAREWTWTTKDATMNAKNHATTNESAVEETHHPKELSWFSAGMRIGVGIGLGTCLGIGIGVGILVNGAVKSKDKLKALGVAVKSKVIGG